MFASVNTILCYVRSYTMTVLHIFSKNPQRWLCQGQMSIVELINIVTTETNITRNNGCIFLIFSS